MGYILLYFNPYYKCPCVSTGRRSS